MEALFHITTSIANIIKPIIEISILWIAFYQILVFFEGTRAFQVLKGILYLLFVFLLSIVLELHTLNWILTKIFGLSIITFLIIFQQELRHGLARLGQRHLFTVTLEESEILAIIEQLTSAVYKLASKKTGCLIALERETKLNTYAESGSLIDGKVTEELLQSIFTPLSPLHDGGIVIVGERVRAASCLFPLSDNPQFTRLVGTRHRAALGMSEQTDAVIAMVSEENGEVAIAVDGKFILLPNREQFSKTLKELLIKNNKRK